MCLIVVNDKKLCATVVNVLHVADPFGHTVLITKITYVFLNK